MTWLNIVLAILLFISAIFLVVAVLLQSGKSKGVSGAITGGSSETYFGRNKGKSRDKKLSLLTTIVAIVFVVLALVAFVTQDYIDEGDYWESIFGSSSDNTSTSTSTNNSSTTASSGATADTEDKDDASSDTEQGDATTGESKNDSTNVDDENSADNSDSETEGGADDNTANE
ncbi:MAG: preprotein translocase subunit SecG [Clostridia bacterium]|nr:preprotein translocase subunit SecG [Clostridia bacterium]